MSKIAIIEDEEIIRDELGGLLQNAGYEVAVVTDFSRPVEAIREAAPDLVLLDLNLPGQDGLRICDGIRKESDVPIIFVTSRSTSMDELNCMLRGGDDYVAKPYQAPILLARIGAVLKRAGRSGAQEVTELTHKGVTLRLGSGTVCCGDRTAELTKNELKILYCLFTHKDTIVPRSRLIDYLWDNEIFIDDNALSVNVTRLREKLDSIGAEGFIETRRGLGYRI